MNDFYVYAYCYPDSGTPFYVGRGHKRRDQCHLAVVSRWLAGQKQSQPILSTPFYKELTRLVSNREYPTIKRLITDLFKKESGVWERYYIGHFGRRDLGKGPLLNGSDGGEMGAGDSSPMTSDEVVRARILARVRKIPASNCCIITLRPYKGGVEAILNGKYVVFKRTREQAAKLGQMAAEYFRSLHGLDLAKCA